MGSPELILVHCLERGKGIDRRCLHRFDYLRDLLPESLWCVISDRVEQIIAALRVPLIIGVGLRVGSPIPIKFKFSILREGGRSKQGWLVHYRRCPTRASGRKAQAMAVGDHSRRRYPFQMSAGQLLRLLERLIWDRSD